MQLTQPPRTHFTVALHFSILPLNLELFLPLVCLPLTHANFTEGARKVVVLPPPAPLPLQSAAAAVECARVVGLTYLAAGIACAAYSVALAAESDADCWNNKRKIALAALALALNMGKSGEVVGLKLTHRSCRDWAGGDGVTAR